MTRWEYRILRVDPRKDWTRLLNEEGKEGWELVSAVDIGFSNIIQTDLYFKRELVV